MKKEYLGVILSLLLMGTIVGCSSNDKSVESKDNKEVSSVIDEENNEDIMEIDERIFVTEVSYIKNHAEEHLGKKIKLQGYYYIDEDGTSYVVRNVENYSGHNGIVGFEFVFNGDLPKENDWIEVVGVLEECEHSHESEEEHSHNHVRLKLESLKVMDTRGQDTVNM